MRFMCSGCGAEALRGEDGALVRGCDCPGDAGFAAQLVATVYGRAHVASVDEAVEAG
jgi:hypothetical protein